MVYLAKKGSTISFVCLFLLPSLAVSCDQPASPLLPKTLGDQTFKTNLTNEINNTVFSIFQDSKDNYWFGTNSGAYRYDGKSLILFTSKDGLFQNQVLDIQEDKSGNIWFSTGGYGVSYFDGHEIISLMIKDTPSLSGIETDTWETNSGDLWFCAGNGAFCYYKEAFNYLPFPEPGLNFRHSSIAPRQSSAYGTYSILKDSNGNLWLGTQTMGVCRFDGTSFTWLSDKGLKGPAVLAIFEDKNGNLWFGNNGAGLFRYDGATLSNITIEKGLANPGFTKTGQSAPGSLARVWSINEDNDKLWIGTGDSGAWSYDGENLINYTVKDGLPAAGIEVIYRDRKGVLWFGTNGAGIYTFNGKRFVKFAIR